MTDDSGVSRRGFMRAAAGGSAVAAAAGTVGAQQNNTTSGNQTGGNVTANATQTGGGNQTSGNQTSGNQTDGGGGSGGQTPTGQPDYGGWFDGVGNFNGNTVKKFGSSEVTIQVGSEGNGGAFAFDPPAVWVSPGTTVIWEWTGQGGGHNVHAMEGADFSSETVSSEGHTYSQTIESGGIVKYQCDPHASLGMKGAVAVGSDVPTSGSGGGGGGGSGGNVPEIPNSAKSLGIASTIALGSTLGLAYFFMKYGGDYQEE